MKPLLEDVSSKNGRFSFISFELVRPRLDFFWHYHPEYELTLIVKGKGRRLIGDSHESFSNGDLVLVGPNLPHTWVSDGSHKGKVEAIVIQFSTDLIGRFTGLNEFSSINRLLLHSKQGLSFDRRRSAEAIEQIRSLLKKNGVERITSLVHILQGLSEMRSQHLASALYQPLRGTDNENRINRVCKYVQKHIAEPLTIHKTAALIHLSPSAFCKFFKRITGKTFSDHVNEIRIGNVCRLLIETDKPVSSIAFETGFSTITYFNRVFLKKKMMKPSVYRRMYRV